MGLKGSPHAPMPRVEVPEDVQAALNSLTKRIGLRKTLATLHISEFTFHDAASPGARVQPKTLERIRQGLAQIEALP